MNRSKRDPRQTGQAAVLGLLGVVGLVALAAMVFAAVCYVSSQRERERAVHLEEQVAGTRASLRESSRDLEEARGRLRSLRRELEEERGLRRSAEDELRDHRAGSDADGGIGARGPEDTPVPLAAVGGSGGAGGRTPAEIVAWLRDLAPKKFATLDPDELDSVVELSLEDGTIDDEDLDMIALLTSLRSLELAGQPITDEGLEVLAALDRLHHVNLSATEVTGAGIAAIAGPELKSLHVDHARWNADDIADLPPLPGLLQLKLNRVTIGDDSALEFPSMPELRHLEIDGTGFSPRGLADLLARCPQLNRIEARGTSIRREDLVDVLRDYPNVEVVLEQGGFGIRYGELVR